MHLFSFRTSQWQYVALCSCWCSYISKGLNRSGTDGLLWVDTTYLTNNSFFYNLTPCWSANRILTMIITQRSYCCCCSLCPVSLLSLLLSLWLLCAVIVTCCIAKLTQGGLLYGGDRPGRCGKPCKHSTDHCHSEGLDCGYHRLQPRSPSWWGDSCSVNAHIGLYPMFVTGLHHWLWKINTCIIENIRYWSMSAFAESPVVEAH